MRGWWSIKRASGIGFTAALLSLLLWPLYRMYGEALALPLAALAGVGGLCGVSILAMTGLDLLLHPRRGGRVAPLRAFDLCLAAGLILLSLAQLNETLTEGVYFT